MTDEEQIVEERDMDRLLHGLTAMYNRLNARALLHHARRAGWMRGVAVVAAHIGGETWMEFVEDMRATEVTDG